MKYELVGGLETHIELQTKTKIFCACTTAFGGDPNTHCCPICIGLPGTLPKLNEEVVRYAILAGLATNCKINTYSKMDRKNYVYPDLSKAYQVSQFDKPLCYDGYIELDSGKRIRITRIHIEEDAGKLVHQRGDTYVDYNRGGVPLIEVVTEPDIRAIEEVQEYLEKLQRIMRYIGVSDCKMQEGSMRCDVNISVRSFGQEAFGTRAEIKNMNSFAFIAKAMAYEFERQVELVQNGEQVVQETRRYDDASGTTESMRGKEDAQDYRYFREPDLVTIFSSDETVEALRQTLPELPDAKMKRYIEDFELPVQDASLLTKYPRIAAYFDEAAKAVSSPKTVSNLILGQIFRRLETEADKEDARIVTPPGELAALVKRLEDGSLRMNLLKATLEKMLDSGETAEKALAGQDLSVMDEAALKALCQSVIDADPSTAENYRGGREKALKALIGGVMRASKGKADAVQAETLLKEIILNG